MSLVSFTKNTASVNIATHNDIKYYASKSICPLDTRRNLNVHKALTRLLGVFWLSYVRSIYVLYPGGYTASATFIY